MLYYICNQGSHDVKLQGMMVATFSVSEELLMCYSSGFGLSEDESSCKGGEEILSTMGQEL